VHRGLGGSVYDEMLADDVPLDALARAGFAMIVDWQNDRAAAERVWESGIDPEARAAMTAAAPLDDPALDPRGRGQYDPDTGLWDWYEDAERRRRRRRRRRSRGRILAQLAADRR
jgi:hypothetical protein